MIVQGAFLYTIRIRYLKWNGLDGKMYVTLSFFQDSYLLLAVGVFRETKNMIFY